MMRIKEKLCEQRGAAAVEFAILLIFLVMLLFGIIEFSLILYNQAVITNASREGARAGIVFLKECDDRIPLPDVQQVVRDYCDKYLISRVKGTVVDIPLPEYWTPGPAGAPTATPDCGYVLKVDVAYDYDFFVLPWLPIPGDKFGAWRPGIRLTARAIMRLE